MVSDTVYYQFCETVLTSGTEKGPFVITRYANLTNADTLPL